jgi:ketosteroid isomerase-like protein
MSNELIEFETFMRQRREAAQAYVNGEFAPLAALVTTTDPATFFGPKGGWQEGAKHVSSVYETGASSFEAGGETHLDIRQIGVGGGLAFWTGVQRATVKLRGREEPVSMDIRVTEVFRHEGEEWKLVHRHADPLVAASADAP